MRWLVAGWLLVATVALTGCSSSPGGYCADLKAKSAVFTSAASATQVSALTGVLSTIDTLRQESPDDMRDEWDTFYYAWEGLVQALNAAGVSGDIPQAGKRPDGVSKTDWADVQAAAEELSSARVADAVTSIEQQALDVCKVDLRS